jgi:threonine aldolase
MSVHQSNGVSPVPSEAVDLRSDTVTRPGEEMRAAIAEAVVGDHVFGDDRSNSVRSPGVPFLPIGEALPNRPRGARPARIRLACAMRRDGRKVIFDPRLPLPQSVTLPAVRLAAAAELS